MCSHLWTFIEPFSPDASFWSVLIEKLWSWTQWRIRNVSEGRWGSRCPSIIWLDLGVCQISSSSFRPNQCILIWTTNTKDSLRFTETQTDSKLQKPANELIQSTRLQTDRDVTWLHVFSYITFHALNKYNTPLKLHIAKITCIFSYAYTVCYICVHAVFFSWVSLFPLNCWRKRWVCPFLVSFFKSKRFIGSSFPLRIRHMNMKNKVQRAISHHILLKMLEASEWLSSSPRVSLQNIKDFVLLFVWEPQRRLIVL